MSFRIATRLAGARFVAPRAARTFATTPRVNVVIKKYTQDHEWISLDTEDASKIATVGITSYAAQSLGDVVYVELPPLTSPVLAGEPFGAVESVKSASDIMSPVAGEVVAVNEALNDKPSIINASPEGEGWIVKLKVESLEAEGLMEEAEYKKFTEE